MFLKWMILFFLGLISSVYSASERAFTQAKQVKFEDGHCITEEFGKIEAGGYANSPNDCRQAFCHAPYKSNGNANIHINRCVGSITCGYTKKGPGEFPDCCPYNDPDQCSEMTIIPLK
ncbi:uncharacterized protein [Parasteatoda tepidariorum]|uniref:uncharacterized protein n=1 Tax=Parasteatoda tepidariorum TaxID=114398 RepID=UPI00077FE2A5